MPDLRDASAEAALQDKAVRRCRLPFAIDRTTEASDLAADTWLRQEPEAGAPLDCGSEVAVVRSSGGGGKGQWASLLPWLAGLSVLGVAAWIILKIIPKPRPLPLPDPVPVPHPLPQPVPLAEIVPGDVTATAVPDSATPLSLAPEVVLEASRDIFSVVPDGPLPVTSVEISDG